MMEEADAQELESAGHGGQEVGNQEDDAERESPDIGVVFFEARVQDDYMGDHEEILSELREVFSSEATRDLYLILWEELLESEAYKGLFPECLLSLKAVEYVGRELSCTSIPVSQVSKEIYAYQMRNSLEPLEDDGTILYGEIFQLPSLRFDGIWEGLVFDKDIRGNLIRFMTNMLKFSRALSTSSRRTRMNRLVLLSGAPGTGKTTLSQALAQKLSIRLNRWYSETKLIQINAATLLSKFFSESAKYIIQIFAAIERMCQKEPKQFICVLIDEIESLAASRATASNRGEVQDGIRATNALLTGFDGVKSQPNLIILCTSNMVETLDAAFMDRCGRHIIVESPSAATRYQILQDGLQDLISSGIINTNQAIPSYRDAQLALLTEPQKPSSRLTRLCELLDSPISQNTFTVGTRSARFLGQLPEVALADGLTSDCCSLDEALHHMEQFIVAQNSA